MTRPVYILSLLSLALLFLFSCSHVHADSHFEGFEAEDDEASDDTLDPNAYKLSHLPLTRSDSDHSSEPVPNPTPIPDPLPKPSPEVPTSPTSTAFDYWDEDEFEGVPPQPETPNEVSKPADPIDNGTSDSDSDSDPKPQTTVPKKKQSYTIEIAGVSFLIMFIINFFTGKRENENIALSWAAKFATKDSIFEKNFSLMGIGEGEDSPLLLKEGQNVFKFYASGRRYCQGLLATMELKSRHDMISRIYNMIVPCRDEISFEVYMNEDSMDHVVFALAKKKIAKVMHKEVRDLQRFAGFVGQPVGGRKWVVDELSVISESKEVAGDLITEAVLDQVFGEKAFEKHGKGFISMHFSDQHAGKHKKMLLFKFALPDVKNMAEMSRLVALIPYYIDLIGRYKLSSQARSKTESARLKAAQEAHKELQNARQEAIQRKKAEKKKMMEEAEAKLSADAIRKREAKERARQMKKAMPKIKMTRAY
ncbi:hypothetical protein K2173_012704 [Erythroxylum novogranatense]|uniref:Coiled-coil domain-containing protein 47 n=1 Tax=Erythroxylum novogranatense TaxID=1862640 RepID=A0AAV8TTG4_9ROSI|nr:hypothetical protein K2173_012704 [Erythroxylum novogranatense]